VGANDCCRVQDPDADLDPFESAVFEIFIRLGIIAHLSILDIGADK